MKNNKKRIIIIMLVVVGIALLCFGGYYIIKYFKNGKSFFQSNNYILEKAGTIDVKTNMIGSATSTAKKNNLLFVSGIGQYNHSFWLWTWLFYKFRFRRIYRIQTLYDI